MSKDGGPAFPTITCDEAGLSNGGSYMQDEGMTLRDYFAAAAMQGICAHPNVDQIEHVAILAYKRADAMLEARKWENPAQMKGPTQ